MFGLGFTEILVILVVALLVLGPERLPSVAKSIGKTLGQLQRGLDDFKRELVFPRLDDDAVPMPPREIIRQGPRGDVCESRTAAPSLDTIASPETIAPPDTSTPSPEIVPPQGPEES